MEEAEVPLENVSEDLHERAHEQAHGGGHGSAGGGGRWITGVALSTALIAALAAVAAMMSAHHADEAIIAQVEKSDKWNFYQAKSIKEAVLESKVETLKAFDKPVSEKDTEKLKKYEEEKKEIQAEAKGLEREMAKHLGEHQILARGVTLFQISIAISAIAALTRRKKFWFVGLAFGAVGCWFLIAGLISGFSAG